MTVLFVGSSPDDIGGSTLANLGANGRDPNYTPIGIESRYSNSDSGGFTIPFTEATGSADVWVHFIVFTDNQWGGDLNDDGYWLRFFSDTTAVARINVSNGAFSLAEEANTANNIVLAMADSTEYTVDFRLTRDGANATIEVFFGGVSQGSITFASTIANYTSMVVEYVDMAFDVGSFGQNFYSEFLVMEGVSTIGKRVATLTPDLDGDLTEWIGDFSALLAASDGANIGSDTAGQRQSWNLGAYGGALGTVHSVVNKFQSAIGKTGPNQITPFVRIGGTNYDGTPFTPDGSTELVELTTNPDTAGAWVTGDLANLQVGALSATV